MIFVRLKKALACILLFIFLLNVVGFYGIFVGIQLKIAREANAQLDNDDYAASEAITIKFALSIPYASNHEYERVTGEFKHQGEAYRLVKQKLSLDTLYLVCIKDKESRHINQALTDYVKTFADKPIGAKQQNTKSVLSVIKDYINTGVAVERHARGWYQHVGYTIFNQSYHYLTDTRIKYPPKAAHI